MWLGVWSELLIIFLLILLNGFFAAAEIAILTARRGRLQQWSHEGDQAAQVALNLAHDADRFLPTVQVGITVVSTLAAAFSGAHFADVLAESIARVPGSWFAAHRQTLALGVVVAGLSFCSLILGELVPKRVALQNAEPLARLVAYPMLVLQRLSQPAVWVLYSTTRVVLRLLGQNTEQKLTVSLEDIQHLIDVGSKAGLLEHAEHRVATQALSLGDRTVREVMRPRIDIDALDIDTPSDEVMGALAMSGFSRVPVCEGDIDHIVGFVYLKDVFLQLYFDRPIDLRRLVRPPLFVPKTLSISRLLQLFQQHRTQLAIVLDEYGGTEGMVTLEDVLEMLVGAIHDERRPEDHAQDIVQRPDGSLLVDAKVNLHELQKTLAVSRWSEPPPRGVGTVSGLVLALLRRPPRVGDRVTWSDFTFEIVDMDDYRIDRLLVAPASPETSSEER